MLNIITGRTGSGKTRYIRNLATEIAKNESGKAVIIVPEQFSFETERGMLELLGNEKINNVEILSFSRLSERLLSQYGKLDKKSADDGVRAVLMSRAIEALENELNVFGRYKKHPELINQILDIVNASGIQILIFLAALQSISPSLYEASAIEGATAWEEFWKITFPMVSPQMIVCLFYTVVDQFLVSNSSVISYINKLALPELQFGYSAAAGWIYTVLIIAVLAVFGLSLNAAVRRYDTV